jgi:electron transfer flavoprotein beta subunit
MKILAVLKMVPDVVEELEVAGDGKSLDLEFLRLIVNERDEHALEEGLLLKEQHGGTVTAVALDAPDIDDVLFTALAKGADRAVKVTDAGEGLSTRAAATLLARTLPGAPDLLPADLILVGCWATDDLDGQTAAILARELDLPYVGIVSRVRPDAAAGTARVMKEFPGGVLGEFETALPAVIGVQAAEKPPRYVPVAKVRAAMKSGGIDEVAAAAAPDQAPLEVVQLTKPEAAGHAEMLQGSPEELAGKIGELLRERGLL